MENNKAGKFRKGTVLMWIGLAMMIAALGLAVFNMWDSNRAGEESAEVMDDLASKIPSGETDAVLALLTDGTIGEDGTYISASGEESGASDAGSASGGNGEGIASGGDGTDAGASGAGSDDVWTTGGSGLSETDAALLAAGVLPDVMSEIVDPDMDMPTIEENGTEYIGYLTIPDLQRRLPVASEWSYPHLRHSPCRYTGSAYKDDMVICGHSYRSHFGAFGTLQIGAIALFTDIDGHTFIYRLKNVEIIQPTDIDKMVMSDADLTLFTCTYGGRTRYTCRFERIN